MKIPTLEFRASGKLSVTLIRRGKRIPIAVDVPNLVLNGAINVTCNAAPFGDGQAATFYTYNDAIPNYVDLNGTWTQSNGSGGAGNIVARATGTGIFPASPSTVAQELKFQDGERCHVLTRASDTSITVSGPARYLVGKTIRRYNTTAVGIGTVQQTGTSATSNGSANDALGTRSQSWTCLFSSATGAYTLTAVAIQRQTQLVARIVLAVPVSVLVDDQLEMTYTFELTHGNRTFAYDLGSEATGLPTQYTATSIIGNGTYFDIITSAANHFAAGDQILLASIVPKKFNIASGSSTSTVITVNTALAHGLAPGNSVTIEDASVGGYNGTFTVDTTPTGTQFTILSGVNPGALGASGTVRLATPVTYWNGTHTVASKPTTSTIRVTSAITGPEITPRAFGSVKGVRYDVWGGGCGGAQISAENATGWGFLLSEANVKTIPTPSSTANISNTGAIFCAENPRTVQADYLTDFQATWRARWNAGFAESRIKQIVMQKSGFNGAILTFSTPQNKATTDRLTIEYRAKITRDLP